MSLWIILIKCISVISICQCWELNVIHTNDMHAWLDEGSREGGICTESGRCYGGFPRIKYFVDSIRRSRNNTLFLNAGDNFQGTAYYSLYKWRAMERFVDLMGIDVMSLGNHEFDDGMKGIEPYLRRVKTPWVCANLLSDNESSFSGIEIHPWKLFNVQGRTVAVIGYLTPDTKYLGWIGNLTLEDEIDVLRNVSREARRQGADVVIALGHSGWDKDLEIASRVPAIDLVVGGHSHTFHYTGDPPDIEVPLSTYPHIVVQTSGKVVPMVQAYAYTKYVGVLNLLFDNKNRLINATGNPVLMDHSVPEDEDMLKILKVYKKDSKKQLGKTIGRISVDLSSVNCRTRECNIGNFITDAVVDHRRRQFMKSGRKGWTDSPIALVNAGDIRASLRRRSDGSVTVGDLLTSLPFDETIVKITVTGDVFKQVLEHSVSKFDSTGLNQGGRFLQMSGVNVIYDPTRRDYDRVISVKVRCGDCDGSTYRMLKSDVNISFLTTGFLSNGGDGYSMLIPTVKESTGDTTYFNMVENYLKRMSPINIGMENRIQMVYNSM